MGYRGKVLGERIQNICIYNFMGSGPPPLTSWLFDPQNKVKQVYFDFEGNLSIVILTYKL